MASVAHVNVEVKLGPVFQAALDVLELTGEMLDLVPDWYEAEKAELCQRRETLARFMVQSLERQ